MKLFKIILLSTLVFGLISCDVLNTPQPQQSLNTDSVFNDPAGLENLVTGLYDGMQSANITGGQYNYTAELLGDNIVWSGSFTTFQNIAQRELTSNNGNFGGWWNTSFREINSANIILQQVEEIDEPTFTDAQKNLLRGEAKFARGMHYFNMAYVFAKPYWDDPNTLAVPIRTTPVIGTSDFENLERASLSAVLDQAEQDLLDASNLLPDTRLRGDVRATRYAAIAFLMRIEMVKRNYTEANNYAQTIIDAGFTLTDSPSGPFENEFSTESIFEIQHTDQDNPGANGGVNAFYTPTSLGGRGDIQISSGYVEAFGNIVTDDQAAEIESNGFTVTDLRSNLLTGLSPTTSATTKYPDGVNNTDNVIIARLADVLLTKAEALTEIATDLSAVPQEVFDILNDIRRRSLVVTNNDGVDQGKSLIEFEQSDFADKQELVDALLLERRIELAFEGDRFYTLKRKGLPVINAAGTFQTNDPCMVFPIPQGEIDANPNMVQNPEC